MTRHGVFLRMVTSPVIVVLKGTKVWQASEPDGVPMFEGEAHQQLGFVMGGRSRPRNIHTLLEGPDGEEEYWKFELGDDMPEMQAGDVLLLKVDVTVDPHECSWVAMTKQGAYFGDGVRGTFIDPEQEMLDKNSLDLYRDAEPVSNLRIILMYVSVLFQEWRDRLRRR